MTSKFKLLAMMLAAAGLMSACGGGSDEPPAPTPAPALAIKSVKVVGDSLSDSGTLGFKFTVQGNDADGKPYKVWAERIAAQYKIDLCPHYRSGSAAMTGYTEDATCTNYAIGGAKINPVDDKSGNVIATPTSIIKQLKDAAAAGVTADDLLLVAGGSNDAATLVEYFVLRGSNAQPFKLLLASAIDAPTLDALFAQGEKGQIEAGALYMQNVAKLLAASLKAQWLDKGAKRVAILNVPAITMTPQFKAVLKQIETNAGPEMAATLAQVFDGWVQAFNTALAEAVKGETSVELVNFYDSFKDQVSNPGKYGYANTTLPVCSVLGVGADIYNCAASQLATNAPAGATGADWWKSYMFSNAFHPTPYGHEQMSAIMKEALQKKGWLP